MGSFTAILRNVSGPQNVDQETCAETIRGMEIIGNSADVKYWAEECIELNPPFEVKSGAAFLADFKPYGKESYYWTVKDHLGAVRVILDDDGDVVHSQDYYAFNLRWDFNQEPEYEWNTIGALEQKGIAKHLDVMSYRMCDRTTGRFLNVDPLSSSMSSWSGYSMNFNSPINYVDPDGRIPIPLIVGAIGAAFEYSSQVYNNFESGATGYDAWVGNVDFADVIVEGIATGTGTKFIGDVAVEGVKASIDVNGNGTVSHIGDGSEGKSVSSVLQSTAENSVFSLVGSKAGRKVNQTFSDDAVKNAKSDVAAATKNLRKAKNKAGKNYSRSSEVYKRDLELAGAKDRYGAKSLGRELGLGSHVGEVLVEKLTSAQAANIKRFITKLINED